MAYGNGDNNKLRKAVPLGVGELTALKTSALMLLRQRYIEVANAMAKDVFVEEPLCGTPGKVELDRKLCSIQKTCTGLNKAYVEKARIAVADHLREIWKRYLNQLVGRLAHCAERSTDRKYYYVPEEIQDTITRAELDKAERMVKDGGFKETIELFRRVVVDGDTQGVSDNQAAVIREIHRQVRTRYSMPVYGRDPGFSCQIHLDYRMVRNKECVNQIDRYARLLKDKDNARYHTFLELSNPVPREPSIRIPLGLSRKTLRHISDESRIKALILEIGDTIGVRAVIEKSPPGEKDINDCETLIGRDFGYANTIALSVVKRDREVDPDVVRKLQAFDKAASQAYLESHTHAAGNILERVRYSGRRFLGLIEKHSNRIDRIKSEIDLLYNKINRMKGILTGYLGLDIAERIPESLQPGDSLITGIHRKFFLLLAKVSALKKLRRGIYRKIAAVKKNWFGFLSNIELELALRYNAAVIREDLSIVTPEKDSPEYKGRTFNKMINNGSKGQYIRRALDKLEWNGIPQVPVPSFFTSTTCMIHSLVDRTMRSGEEFLCPLCGKPRHADENAADTIANYLLLRPLQQ